MAQHIVVFNHSTSLLFLFRSILLELGYEVSTYLEITPQVDMLKSLHPDLLIFGNLSDRDAGDFDIIRQVRRDADLGSLPVILCSTSPERFADLVEQENIVGVQVLEKPFSFNVLRAAVSVAIGDGKREP